MIFDLFIRSGTCRFFDVSRGKDMSRMNIFARTALLTLVLGASASSLAPEAISSAHAQDSRLGGFLAATALATAAENITIETDAATYAIKHIELHGTSLTSADLAALLDPKAAARMTDRFAKLTASEIVIPELTVTSKSTPVQKTTYLNIKLSDVRQGKASAADIESARFSISDDNAETIDGSYGPIHAQSVDLTLASRVLSEVRQDSSEPLKILYESFSLDNFKMSVSGKEPFSMAIAKVSGRNLKARALATHPADIQMGSAEPAQLNAFIKDFLTSFESEDLVASDIGIQSQTDGKPVSITLAKMSVESFGNTNIGDIGFDSLGIKAQGSTINIGDIHFKGIDFERLRQYQAKKTPEDAETNPNQQTANYIPRVSAFIVNNADISLADETAADSTKKTGAFSLAHFEMDGGIPIESAPAQMKATLDHFTIDLEQLKDTDVKSLTDMGYSKLDFSSRIEMEWNASAEELTVNDISLSGTEMGAVKVSGLIDNVTKDFFSGDSTAMQAAAFGALVKKVEIQIDNAGLFEKATAAAAKAQHKSVDEIKKSYITAAAIGLPSMLDNKPAAKIIGAALAKFIANPKSFHLVAVSAEGLGAADFVLMKDPGSLLDAVEIKANANE